MVTFTRIVDGIIKGGLYVTMVAVVLMMLMMTSESVFRTFFGFSTMVADEFSGYFLMASVFMGIGYCMRVHALLRVTIVYDRMSPMVRSVLQIIFDVMSLGFVLILAYQLFRVVGNSYRDGTLSISQAEIPVWIPQTIMPIGISILILALIVEIGGSISELKALRRGETIAESREPRGTVHKKSETGL